MTPEGRVKNEVKAALAAHRVVPFSDILSGKAAPGDYDGFYYMPVQGHMAVRGVHDFVGCWFGVFFSIETKAPDNPEDATQHQRKFDLAVNSSGGVSAIGVRSGQAVAELRKDVLMRAIYMATPADAYGT